MAWFGRMEGREDAHVPSMCFRAMDDNRKSVMYALLAFAVAYFHPETFDPENRITNVPDSGLEEEYDFVIVGGGSAGKWTRSIRGEPGEPPNQLGRRSPLRKASEVSFREATFQNSAVET